MSSIFHMHARTAIKDHYCHWCGQRIVPGSKYAVWRYGDGGTVDTVKAHQECCRAWNDAAKEEYDGMYRVMAGEHCRGCTCAAGGCRCE